MVACRGLLFFGLLSSSHALLLEGRRDDGCVPPGMVKARVNVGFDMVVLGYKDIVSSGLLNRHYWEIHNADEFAVKMGSTLQESGTFLD
eukprot:6476352-Amphidinium_carterae.3